MTSLETLKTNDSRKYGVRIVFIDSRNERPDYIDPLDDESISETETEYIFDNGYPYPYLKSEVKELQRYELCQECLYAVENCHCPDREESHDLT